MAWEIQSKVGPQGTGGLTSIPGDQVLSDLWLGHQGQVITSDFLPRYGEATYRGQAFCGANTAATAVTNLNTTATGLILYNPLGSGRNIFLVDIAIALATSALATFTQIVLAANITPAAKSSYTFTTPLTVQATMIGSTPSAVGLLSSAATLPVAPVNVRAIWTPITSAAAQTGQIPSVKDEVAGAIGIAPGCSVSLSATAAVSVIASMTWIEAPV